MHTLRVSPQSSVAHKILGLEYAKRNDYETALRYFERANKFNPKDRDNAFNLGTAYLNQNQIGDAIIWLRIAVDAYDKPADAHTNLGRAFLQQAHVTGAYNNRDKAGNSLLRAKHEFEKAIDCDANHVEARINLGIVLGMSGNSEEAIHILAEAVRLAPDNADARYNYGMALLNGGKPGEASVQFKEALRIKEGYPGAAEQLSAIENDSTNN